MIDYVKIALEYYENPLIIVKMLPFMVDRECGFICKVEGMNDSYRYIRLKRVQTFKDFYRNPIELMKKLNMFYNVYSTVATYREGMDVMSRYGMTPQEREENKDMWIHEISDERINGYDWFIDIDCESFSHLKIAAADTNRIYEYLVDKGFHPRINFSGCGFHLYISYDEIPHKEKYSFRPMDKNNIYFHLRKETKKLNEKFSEWIDLKLFDKRRIAKVPYSLVVSTDKSKDIYIAKIMTTEELKNFDIKMVQYEKN